MKEARVIIYLVALVYFVASLMGAFNTLAALHAAAPLHAEYKVMVMAIPGAFAPAVFVMLLAYLISCVDKD